MAQLPLSTTADSGLTLGQNFINASANFDELYEARDISGYITNTGDYTPTGTLDFTGATSVSLGPLTFTATATLPTTTGRLELISGVTGFTSSLFAYYNGTMPQYLIASNALPIVTGQVPTYNSTTNSISWAVPEGGGGGTLSISQQTADPTFSEMNTGQLIVATGSGDLFYKSATGGYVFAGVYTVDSVAVVVPEFVSASVDGYDIEVVFDVAVTKGVGWTEYLFTVNASVTGSGIGMYFTGGDGTTTWNLRLNTPVVSTDTVTLNFTTASNAVESSTGGDLATFSGESVTNDTAVVGSSDYDDIILHINADGVYSAPTYTIAATETGPTVATTTGNAQPSSLAALVGSEGIRLANSGDGITFATGVQDAGLFQYAFQVRFLTAFPTSEEPFISFMSTDGTKYCGVYTHNSDSNQGYGIKYRDNANNITTLETTGVNATLNDTDIIVVEVDTSTNTKELKVYSPSTGLLQSSMSLDAMTKPTVGFSKVVAYNDHATAEIHIDSLMMSDMSDATRDFYSDTISEVRLINRNDTPVSGAEATLDYDSGAPTSSASLIFRSVSNRQWAANLYIPAANIDVVKVEVALQSRVGLDGTTMHAEIYSDNGDFPDTQVGANSSGVNFSLVPTTADLTYIEFTFPTPVSLTGNGTTRYYVVVKPDWTTTSGTYCAIANRGASPDGLFYWTGTTWAASGGTIGGFKVYE